LVNVEVRVSVRLNPNFSLTLNPTRTLTPNPKIYKRMREDGDCACFCE